MRLCSSLFAIGLLLAGCAAEDAATTPTEVGTVQLPLTATGTTGTEYRLEPARFRITATEFNRVFAAGDIDVLRVGLAPGQYQIQLLGGWVLNAATDDGFAPVEAVPQSPNPQDFEIVEGVITDIVFAFGVGDDKIAFGNGQARVEIEVDDCSPTPEILNGIDDDCNGAVDDAPECIPEVCDNEVDDDGDGDIDCDDVECADALGCGVPPVGTTGNTGVAAGADWQVCRADEQTAWISAGTDGGTYDATLVCQTLGYDGADMFGGNCNEVCGYCGTPGLEQYDSAGIGWPDAYRSTVNWRCANGFIPPFVGQTGNLGVATGADWQVCRADHQSAWLSAGTNGGTYDAPAICASLGYAAAVDHGGNCNDVCGYCGTPGLEQYDGAGLGWPDAYRATVTWSCVNP